MGYRNNRNQFRPRPPKGPVKLAFGLVAKKDEQATPPPPPKPPEPLPRQEIVGTLKHKGVKIDDIKPLPEPYLQRILANLKRIYEEGRFLSARSTIDFKDGELHITFSYDQNAVDRIKGLDRTERAWDPDLKMWRVFPGAFDDVFDILGRGVKLTEDAYDALVTFVQSNYYAHVGRGKMGKLIVREAWYEELDFENTMPAVEAAAGSNAARGESAPADAKLLAIRERISAYAFKRKPYKHQLEGIEYLLSNAEAALLDEMGCGKSFQIACSVGMLFQKKEIDRVLIVAPMSLVKTWQEELKLATDATFQVIGGSPANRAKQLASAAPIFIVHYEGLRLEEANFAEWLKGGRSMLVLDESQRIKNLEAQTTQAALRLRPHVLRCVVATGTPIANRPLDLFSQYLVMDKGRTFGTKFPAFKNTFCEIDVQKIQVGRRTIRIEKFLGVRNSEELRKRIMSTSLRRLKSEVLDLPPVLYKDFVVELRAEQRSMYAQMRDNLKVELANMSSDQVLAEASTIMVKLLRLSQIASNPCLLDPAYEGSNAKLSELDDLLEDVFADDSKKVIVWSHYVQNVHLLVQRFNEKFGEKCKAVGHTGEMDVEERQVSISAFQDDVDTRLFVATPQSAKEGLTLLPRDGRMKADTMIYLDLSFDAGSYVQSQARFHRIGQTAERCLVVHLVGETTVDEYIRKTVIEKIKTATELLDDGNPSNAAMLEVGGRLSKEELLKIL
ncbi:MAG: DEAD/DEAH box helicase [Silvanigrellales bacterium]|nr:DEAD/DEAH box helicase [Silvanigrellales bacterium]